MNSHSPCNRGEHAATLLRIWLLRCGCVALCAALSACDGGLSPELSSPAGLPGLAGTIRVTGPWPPQDSLFDLRVVAFRAYPPKNILEEFLQGTLEFSDALQLNVAEQAYELRKEGLRGAFAYVVVAQQYGPNAFQHWRVVGVYNTSGDPAVPSPVLLGAGAFVEGVDIAVDFTRLPPQPF